jgi:hypothetical protein
MGIHRNGLPWTFQLFGWVQLPVNRRQLLKADPPPKFSGVDFKLTFTVWWPKVKEYLAHQPAGDIGSESFKVYWTSNLLVDEAQEWYSHWRDTVIDPTWREFEESKSIITLVTDSRSPSSRTETPDSLFSPVSTMMFL